MRIPNFRRSLLAVMLGSVVYYALLPHLPWVLRHRPDRLDAGMFLWFVICSTLYWLFGVYLRRHPASERSSHS
jgi:hypothetical protein